MESVRAYPIRLKASERLRGGTFSYAYYQTVLVQVLADGVEGWGEAMTRFDTEATALIVRYLATSIKGETFHDPLEAWERCWRELRIRGHTRGTDVEALSGIEIALYDCFGKLEKRPVGSLLSNRTAARVPAFAGSILESRGPLPAQVEAAKELGLRGAKVKIGFGVEKDLMTLRAVRKLWTEGMIVADANGSYEASEAARACKAFAEIDLAWFEEPVLSDDLEGYAALKRSRVTIGAGESWYAGDFDWPIERRLIGVVEPSVSRCGGLHVEVGVAKKAGGNGIRFSPMTGMNSVVSLAASVHAASAVESLGVEYNPFENPLQSELASGIDRPKGGYLRVPDEPGLGLEVDMGFVRAHSR